MIATAQAACKRCAQRFIVFRRVGVLEVIIVPELVPLAEITVKREVVAQMDTHDAECPLAEGVVGWSI